MQTNQLTKRLATYSTVSTELALLEMAGSTVFVKRVRGLTDIERLPEDIMSTANLFNLPTFCQYGLSGIGTPGFGVWRELATHVMTTNWVLTGECPNFPLMYHWRLLPRPLPGQPTQKQLDEVERDVAYWEGSPAVRARLLANLETSAEIVLFLEYFPENLPQWLPKLAPALPLAIPVPLGKGIPEASYPWHWSICRWLAGENASVAHIDASHEAATDLANFLIALQKIDTSGGPPSRRGVALSLQDKEVRRAIHSLQGKIDTNKATILWEECLKAPAWDKPPVWLHGDLLPGNLLVLNGKLSAVIDWGLAGIGEPACDLIAAWSIFSSKTRQTFRTILAADEATWARGRGWALSIAVIILPYYWDTNPGLVSVARRILSELLDET